MARKGISVWVFSSLTFIALVHLTDAISALVFGNPIRILQLYPFINQELQLITPAIYFWTSFASSLFLWGITCAIAFENPVETFLNKVLSDAKSQSAVENQLLESKSEVLDAMFETMESSGETLANVKDMVNNVRMEVKDIPTLRDGIDKMRTELTSLKKDIRRIDEKIEFPNACPTCAKPLLPEFKICPYCGENIKLLPEKIITVKDYR